MAKPTALRWGVAACLVFSGLSALVYQIVWVRLLGFTFGTTTEAVSTVLAVFFAGLALGNLAAATRLGSVRRPLRLYALLEIAIGLYALASVPLLGVLDGVHALVGVGLAPATLTAVRVAGSALVLLPPTLAMGATLPVVARALVTEDATLGRWSAILYAANTLGAVLGAYLCGFWLIPGLGLRHTVLLASLANFGVGAAVLLLGRGTAAAAERASGAPAQPATLAPAERVRRAVFLAFFGVSGFVAIGYEIVWSKIFGIVMEGTLYGFAAVLACFLLGIAVGSFAVSWRVDRIRDLPRAFGWMHAAIAVAVGAGIWVVPDLPFHLQRISELGLGDPLHRLLVLVLPLVLVPTALFGAAFPVLIRIYTRTASATGRGIGVATAVNTVGSILASLAVGFWWIPGFGMDRSLLALLLLDGTVALAAIAAFQAARGWRAFANVFACAAVLCGVFAGFDGVQVDRVISGQPLRAPTLAEYRRLRDQDLAWQRFRAEGRASIVTVYVLPTHRLLRTNALPEAGYGFQPPYYPSDVMLLGVLPYLAAEGDPKRGLLVGLGGANTLDALLQTGLERIDVVELERAVVDAQAVFHAGREDPLADPRVHLAVNDGRNELRVAALDGRGPYDVISSQPSHPWRIGVANLFTEEYFRLARELLSEGGRFAVWINGFRIDRESLLAIVASFERVFPGSLFFDVSHERQRTDFLLLGGREPVELDPATMRRRMAEPRLAALLRRFRLDSVEDLLAGFEAPAEALAASAPGLRNTDDDAFVEARVPRRLDTGYVDFATIEAGIVSTTPALPPLASDGVDVARIVRALLDNRIAVGRWGFGPRIERLLSLHGQGIDPVLREALAAEAGLRDPLRRGAQVARLASLAAANPTRPEPWRALAAARRAQGDAAGAAAALGQAFERSGDAADAFEAARALAAGDPALAEGFIARIPEAERGRFPDLAYFDALRVERDGANEAELRAAYDALLAYRDTRAGRQRTGVDEALARLAARLGDERAAQAYGDLAHDERRRRGQAALARARTALDNQRLEEAAGALAEAERLLPSDRAVFEVRARLALARGDAAAFAAAIAGLREWSPSFDDAVISENRLRQESGLPLLPRLTAEELLAAPPPTFPGEPE